MCRGGRANLCSLDALPSCQEVARQRRVFMSPCGQPQQQQQQHQWETEEEEQDEGGGSSDQSRSRDLRCNLPDTCKLIIAAAFSHCFFFSHFYRHIKRRFHCRSPPVQPSRMAASNVCQCSLPLQTLLTSPSLNCQCI